MVLVRFLHSYYFSLSILYSLEVSHYRRQRGTKLYLFVRGVPSYYLEFLRKEDLSLLHLFIQSLI